VCGVTWLYICSSLGWFTWKSWTVPWTAPSPSPTTGDLVLHSIPAGATLVFGDRTFTGLKPGQRIQLPEGTGSAEVRCKGYLPWKGQLSIGAAAVTDFRESLQKSELKVLNDGSGDYRTVQEAVDAAPPGVVIVLGRGDYRLGKSLDIISKSVSLKGQGMDATTITYGGEGAAVYQLLESFAAKDLTFRRTGGKGVVVTVSGGKAEFIRCRFTGGRCSEENTGGFGLSANDEAAVTLSNCEATDNEGSGVAIFAKANVTIVESAFTDNDQGIQVSGEATPTLERNNCESNDCGICYFDSAGGTAKGNYCARNRLHGIQVSDNSKPRLESNTCVDNQQVGIRVSDSANPELGENTCYGNGIRDVSDNSRHPPHPPPASFAGYAGVWKTRYQGTDVVIILKQDGRATVQGKDGAWRAEGDHVVMESADPNDRDRATARLSDDGRFLFFSALNRTCTFTRE